MDRFYQVCCIISHLIEDFYQTIYRSLTEFCRFVDPISASGGGDTPEDIMGGLKITFSRLKWRESAAKVYNKCVI